MDLADEAVRLQLDLLALELSAALSEGGVAHALLKGPSTSVWLYSPPRTYSDVDLLVAPSRLDDAARVLISAGLARAAESRAGEEADHSLLLTSTEGFEIDLHRSLPAVPVRGDTVWTTLAAHVEPFDLGLGVLPALDEPGRCLVLALHALGNPAGVGQAVEDLRRARRAATAASWTSAGRLAKTLGVRDLFEAGLHLVDPEYTPGSPRARLYASGAPSGALALQRLADAPRRELPRLLLREIVPSRGFLQHYHGRPIIGPVDLVRGHVRRWVNLLHGLPAALRVWWATRRE